MNLSRAFTQRAGHLCCALPVGHTQMSKFQCFKPLAAWEDSGLIGGGSSGKRHRLINAYNAVLLPNLESLCCSKEQILPYGRHFRTQESSTRKSVPYGRVFHGIAEESSTRETLPYGTLVRTDESSVWKIPPYRRFFPAEDSTLAHRQRQHHMTIQSGLNDACVTLRPICAHQFRLPKPDCLRPASETS